MKIYPINDLSNTNAVTLLKTGLSKITDTSLLFNYHPDYASDPRNLFFILDHGRFKNGNYYVLEDNEGNYAGSAGWNAHTDDIALALVRAFIPEHYRTKYLMAEYILPKILEETTTFNRIWITANQNNRVIYSAFEMLAKNKKAGIVSPWPECYKLFRPIGRHIVNYTDQYVAEYKRS